MSISREQAELRLAEVLEQWIGACSQIRMLEAAFFDPRNVKLTEEIAATWREATTNARAVRRTLKNVEDGFHANGGRLEELLRRLEQNMAPKLQRQAAA
jgi:hypothetical protein